MASNNNNNKSKTLSKRASAKLTPLLMEDDWVIEIRRSIQEDVEEEDMRTTPTIFRVPQELVSCKPEAYIPQLLAFGPHHHWRSQVYDMERYKLAAARKTQACLNGVKFEEIVEQIKKKEFKIRGHYHKYLDLNQETLAWMMAIDASFLLEFLETNAAVKQAAAVQEAPPATVSRRMEQERMKTCFSMIIRDVTKLENQIPLFVLRKLLTNIYSSKPAAEVELSKMLIELVKEVSPFKTTEGSVILKTEDIRQHSHILEVLYHTIVPKLKAPQVEWDAGELLPTVYVQKKEEVEIKEAECIHDCKPKEEGPQGDPTLVWSVMGWLRNVLSSLNISPTRFLKQILLSKPVQLLVQVPWKVMAALPVLSIIKVPVERFFLQLMNKPKSDNENPADGAEKPPLVEEITIPSVSELVRAGVKFSPTSRDLTTIRFDTKTITMYLPTITLDVNTEVILRNLVAYEASAVTGPLVFTRYAELMYGVIDTAEDVKILRNSGIIVNRMKSDAEAAQVWNGMSKSLRLNKVGFLDKTIGGVNKYYGSRWKVKCKNFMKNYVFASWPILTFLAAGLLLFLTCVQAFCSVYSCSSRLKEFTNMGNDTMGS